MRKAIIVLYLLAAQGAAADTHSDGWQRAEIRECEMRLAAGYASNPDRFPSGAAEFAKRECKQLREGE